MSNLRIWDFLKYSVKAVDYKFEQYRLSTRDTAVVQTTKGQVKGAKRLSVWGNAYFSFEGIPYAKPPLDELRFRAPVAALPWDDVLDCTGPAEIPLQAAMVFGKYKGSEDCLYLNVFTNEITTPSPRPVMVWIYGGGFQIGEATRNLYSPDYFMSKDIILVTIAYRLGAFGFLSLDDPNVDIPGNAGLKDQILALRWVKDNIAAFGGDPNNVTVFGESAGGASTHLCMLSENSKGLLNKAIVMSGTVLCPWVLPPPNQALKLAKSLGYKGDEISGEIYQFLKLASGPDIHAAASSLLSKEEKHNRVLFAFGPVIEPYKSKDSVLTEDPVDLLKNTWSNDIPMMIGGTSFEGLLCYTEVKNRKATLDEVGDCENLIPPDVKVDRSSERAKEMGLQIKKAYFGEEECSEKTMMQFLEIESYRSFWHPIYRTALYRMQYSRAPTYVYRFDYDSPDGNTLRNLFCGRGVKGVAHGDDLCYLFRYIFSHRLTVDSAEYRTTKAMIDIWTSFALNSDPNCASLQEVKFEPLSKDKPFRCLNISNTMEYIDLPELQKIEEVWNNLYPKGKL